MGASSASIGTICYSSEPAAGHHETGRSPLSSVEETDFTSKQVERCWWRETSLGHLSYRSGYCHVTPTVHCRDEAGQQSLLDQQSSHSMDRHAFLPPLGSSERQRVNQDRRTSNDEDTMCCICFPRPPLVAFMKTTPLLRRHHRQTLLLISEIFSTAF
jgi:hypothetical protein